VNIAFYIEDGLEQIVLTPESKYETDMLGKLHDGTRSLEIHKGSFFDCRGGWKRYTPFRASPFSYGTDDGDESTMIVLRPAVPKGFAQNQEAP
jgi:hypothetical protein